jgi:WD40 repeat protein
LFVFLKLPTPSIYRNHTARLVYSNRLFSINEQPELHKQPFCLHKQPHHSARQYTPFMANAPSLCKHVILSSFKNVIRMENSFDSIYSCSKITSVCRILISISSEKIICVQMRNLREINTMNNSRVKNIFCFFICHSVIL